MEEVGSGEVLQVSGHFVGKLEAGGSLCGNMKDKYLR